MVTQKVRGTLEKPAKTNYAFYGIFALVTYFIWCDLGFFGELTIEKTRAHVLTNTTSLEKKTIKLRMQDHFGHYIYIPFCEWLDRNLGISKIPGISPNIITAIHFLIALIAGRLAASTCLLWRRFGVILYEIRTMLDALDGVVYRAQSSSHEYLSGWGTYGYMIDGLADTIGGLFIMCGTIYRLNVHPPFKNPEIALKLKSKDDYDAESGEKFLSDDSSSDSRNETYGLKRYSRQTVNVTIIFYTINVIMRSALWDHFNHGYHGLLAEKRLDISPMKQAEVLGYGSTWVSLWLWKVMSADAFMHYTLIAVFFGKLWAWLRFNLYAGIPNIMIVSMICQIHLMQMRYLLGVTH